MACQRTDVLWQAIPKYTPLNTPFSIQGLDIVKQERRFPTMTIATVQERTTPTHITTNQTTGRCSKNRLHRFLQSNICKHVVLLVFTALLLFSSLVFARYQPAAQA